ncbi:MAG: ribokinase [Chthonomonadales bacterium]
MRTAARIVVVGSSNTDMVVRTPRIPSPGETVLGGEFVMTQGGKGANQAVAAARLGAEVSLVARVGQDVFGTQAIASIGTAGVNTAYIVRDDTAPSGVALIFVDGSGQNSIVVAPGANSRLSPADVDAARPAFEAASVVVLQLEIPLDTVTRAIELAKELEKTVLLNPAPVPSQPLPMAGVDVVTPNEVEAAMLLGHSIQSPYEARDAAVALVRRLGVGAAVVTMGARGAVVATMDRVQEIPGKKVNAVDTTAAGDCFTGALATALGEGMALGPAAHFANAAAALACTRVGAQASMPYRNEVEAFIGRR